jgi:hypothetical protein
MSIYHNITVVVSSGHRTLDILSYNKECLVDEVLDDHSWDRDILRLGPCHIHHQDPSLRIVRSLHHHAALAYLSSSPLFYNLFNFLNNAYKCLASICRSIFNEEWFTTITSYNNLWINWNLAKKWYLKIL